MHGAIPLRLQYVFMAWSLVKHRDNFTLYFYHACDKNMQKSSTVWYLVVGGENRPSSHYRYNVFHFSFLLGGVMANFDLGKIVVGNVFAREKDVSCLQDASWEIRHVSWRKRLLCDVIFGDFRV
jgi:hypothetical protein